MSDYERIQRLGAGNFGEVWLVYDRALDVQLAVKYVRPSRVHDPTNFYQEPRALRDLRHDNIVRVEDAGRLRDGTLYIAMEYLRRGSLESRHSGRPLQLTAARRYLCDISWALEYAHQKQYVHRDIKPANILIGASGEGKLSDFGLATRVPRGESASPYGYLTHVAPEVFQGDGTTAMSDLYALGVTGYRLANGDATLPQPADLGELQDMILQGDYPDRSRYRPHVPDALRRVLNKAMSVDPAARHTSVAMFRRAIERITIRCDWTWRSSRRSVRYSTKIGNSKIFVKVVEGTDGRFTIETTKKASSGVSRRVRNDCVMNLTRLQLRRRLHQILARYITDGK